MTTIASLISACRRAEAEAYFAAIRGAAPPMFFRQLARGSNRLNMTKCASRPPEPGLPARFHLDGIETRGDHGENVTRRRRR